MLVETVEDAEALELPEDTPLAYITQTTLSVDETPEIIEVLKRRFPQIHGPQREDICYATSNRQWAVKELLAEIDLLLVDRLAQLVQLESPCRGSALAGVGAHLIDDETEIDERWLEDVETVGLTSGASAPERLVDRVCDWFRARGVKTISRSRPLTRTSCSGSRRAASSRDVRCVESRPCWRATPNRIDRFPTSTSRLLARVAAAALAGGPRSRSRPG